MNAELQLQSPSRPQSARSYRQAAEAPILPVTQLKIDSQYETTTDSQAEFEVEFEVIPTSIEAIDETSAQAREIQEAIKDIDKRLAENEEKLGAIDTEIDRLTSHADGIDYSVAVASGIVCGLIDSFFVGEFDFANAKKWSNKTANQFIDKFAKKHGFKAKNGSKGKLKNKVAFLENMFESPTDSVYSGKGKGISTFTHHLDDWSHHPTIVGWACSIMTQFTAVGYFTNSDGEGMYFDADKSRLVGGNFTTKICAGTVNWFGHLVSDLAGSNQTAGKGMGLPGPILSLAREVAQLPGLKHTNLPKLIGNAFSKGKFDFRSEMAVAHELGRQAIPVVINEIFVRLFYFIRRLVQQWRTNGFNGIEWRKTLPFNNRTIVRMMTVATGTFTAVDLADAAIRGALGSGGEPAAFMTGFLLRVNFVGVGRFAVAVFSDLRMGAKLGGAHWKKIVVQNEKLHLLNAKLFYKSAEMWMEAEKTEKAMQDLYRTVGKSLSQWGLYYSETQKDLKSISTYTSGMDVHNPGLRDQLIDELEGL